MFMQIDTAKGEIINLGNPEEYTVIDLAHHIIKATESDSKIQYLPLPADDPKQRRPDISKGWEPSVSVDEGIRRTIAFFTDAHNT
jgi:UDP-glucuronate decarboxylase